MRTSKTPETQVSLGKRSNMKTRLGRTVVFALTTALVLLAGACKQSSQPAPVAQQAAPKPAPSVPNINVSPAVQAKAKAPKPGPHATRKPAAEAFGSGAASVHFKGRPQTRSFWAEQLDVDRSGNPVLVDEAWDNHDKVLYISNDRDFTCGNGQTATGSTLMAVYAKGNPRKHPAGSGWWVSQLHAGDCGVPREGLYGCRFDAAGKNSDCGGASIQADANDVVIVPLPKSDESQNSAPGAATPSTGGSSSSPSPGAPPASASPSSGSSSQ